MTTRLLITGVSGFLGNVLTMMATTRGYEVWGQTHGFNPVQPFYRKRVGSSADRLIGCTQGDLRNYGDAEIAVVEAAPDIVVHLAALTQVGDAIKAPLTAFEVNTLATANILEACRRHGCRRVILASTDKVYGQAASSGEAIAEDSPVSPTHPYDVSKAASEMIAASYASQMGLLVMSTRCGNFYGPGDTNWQRLIPGVMRAWLLGERPILRSNGTLLREYNYIFDIGHAYLRLIAAMERRQPGVRSAYNISCGTARTVDEVVSMMARLFRHAHDLPPVHVDTAKAEGKVLHLDSARFTRDLNWYSSTTMLIGLRSTAQWLTEYLGLQSAEVLNA